MTIVEFDRIVVMSTAECGRERGDAHALRFAGIAVGFFDLSDHARVHEHCPLLGAELECRGRPGTCGTWSTTNQHPAFRARGAGLPDLFGCSLASSCLVTPCDRDGGPRAAREPGCLEMGVYQRNMNVASPDCIRRRFFRAGGFGPSVPESQ